MSAWLRAGVTIVDDELETSYVVSMAAGGDHERLLRMSRDPFHDVMSAQPHGHFCKTPAHGVGVRSTQRHRRAPPR